MSIGGLLVATQIGVDFDEESAFWGIECEVKDAVEHEVNRTVEQQSTKVDDTIDILHGIWASEQVESPPFLQKNTILYMMNGFRTIVACIRGVHSICIMVLQ